MRKLKKFIVCAFAVLTLCGCTDTNSEKQNSVFVIIEDTYYWDVVYHRETKVMNVVSFGSHNNTNFTLLVNADGTPMLYEG